MISLLIGALWGAALLDRSVLRPEVDADEIKAITRATTPHIGFYAAMIVLAVFAPRVAIFGYLVIAVVALLRARGDRPRRATTPT